MKLIDLLREECIVTAARPTSKTEALQAIVGAAKQSELLKDVSESALFEGLQAREALGSTAFGEGIAIPHCRLDAVEHFVVGAVTAPEGVDFDSLDGAPVKLFVFIIAPEGDAKQHIKLLSAISHVLQIPGAREEIVGQKTAVGVRDSFLRHTRADIETEDRAARNLIHVFVQDEEKFRELVREVAGADPSSAAILEGENSLAYIAKMPLFASFLRDEPKGFCKVILAVVDKGLTNDTLRRIEGVTGPLDECSGVMVIVQELFYSAGSLGAAP